MAPEQSFYGPSDGFREVSGCGNGSRMKDDRSVVAQIRADLVSLINTLRLEPGDQIPTEAQLTAEFGVSRPALREALKALEQDGLVEARHGRGRFIASSAALRVERPITCFESATQMVSRAGYSLTSRLLSVGEMAADAAIATALRCDIGTQVICLERLRLRDGKVVLYCVDYIVRHAIPARIYDVDWTGSLTELLHGHGHGPKMSTAAASAVPLPADVAAKFDLGDFGPALLIVEICYSSAGSPVTWAHDYHRGDSFSFNFVRK